MSQSETKTMPEAKEFELFYSGFTGGLIVRPSRSATVMLANNQSDDEYIDVIEKKAYSALKAECERLKTELDEMTLRFQSLQSGFEIEKLESENAALIAERTHLETVNNTWAKREEILRAENERLTSAISEVSHGLRDCIAENTDFRAALELYADRNTWLRNPSDNYAVRITASDASEISGYAITGGKLARAVLSKHDKKETL